MDPSTPGMGPNAQKEARQVKVLVDQLLKLGPNVILIPDLPPDVSVADNIKEAKQHTGEWFWFASQVCPYCKMDYAHTVGPQYRDAGNFNYGAMGTAMGFSPQTLHFMAGVVQILSAIKPGGHSEFPWGLPGQPFTPGADSPVDYFWIDMGIDLGNFGNAHP
jgi:hypothetical protein